MTTKILKGLLVSVMVSAFLGGCTRAQRTTHQSAKSSTTQSTTKQTRSSATQQETPPASAMTTILSKLTNKVPEDQSSRTNGGETTYSQFYYRQHAWHWALSSAKRGTIVSSKVGSLQKSAEGTYKLAMTTPKGTAYTLTLMTLGTYYTVKTSYQHIAGTYIIQDNDQAWHRGAPQNLIGTWSTDIYPVTIQGEPKIVYERTRFYISSDDLDGNRMRFTKHYTMTSPGAGWGANDENYYKQLSGNTYLLKTYSSVSNGLMAVYRIQTVGQQIKMDFDDGHGTQTLSHVSDQPGLSVGEANSPATNLTKKQIQAWISRHLSDFGQEKHDYQTPLYMFSHDKHGRINVDVYSDDPQQHAPAAAYIGQFRITANGVLEGSAPAPSDMTWKVVSDDPTR